MTLSQKFYKKTGIDFTDFYISNKNYYIFLTQKIVNNYQFAEDIVSDSFVKILENIDSFDNTKSKITTWCYAIVKYNAIYSKKVVDKIDIVDIVMDYIKDLREDECYEYDIELKNKRVIDIIMNDLKENHKEIIILREFKNKSYKYICDLLNINENTAKSRLLLAKKQIIKIYKNKYE